jgi:TctA family transporter
VRQALTMSQGDIAILFSRPLSATMLVCAAAVLVLSLAARFRRRPSA